MADVVDLAGAFCSGRYEKSIMEGMVKAVVISLTDPLLVEDVPDGLIEVPQSIVAAQLFENLPKTDECFKFMFYVMKLYWDFVWRLSNGPEALKLLTFEVFQNTSNKLISWIIVIYSYSLN